MYCHYCPLSSKDQKSKKEHLTSRARRVDSQHCLRTIDRSIVVTLKCYTCTTICYVFFTRYEGRTVKSAYRPSTYHPVVDTTRISARSAPPGSRSRLLKRDVESRGYSSLPATRQGKRDGQYV